MLHCIDFSRYNVALKIVPCNITFTPLSADSYIGKMRSLISDLGRQGDLSRTLLLGNPASDNPVSDNLIKQYLKTVSAK